jgi:hypothetical protein
MGLRYDLDHNAQGEAVKFLPWLSGKRPTDKNNFAPRLGFAYQVNDKSVIRGGWGLFFTQLEGRRAAPVVHPDAERQHHAAEQRPRGLRPQPVRRPKPTWSRSSRAGATSSACRSTRRTASRSRSATDRRFRWATTRFVQPHGVDRIPARDCGQHGLRQQLRVTGGRAEERRQNLNSSINPATGRELHGHGRGDRLAHLPFPSWGPIAGEIMNGRSNYYGWENTFTKRFSNRWQANATYTLSYFKDDGGIGAITGPFVTTLDPSATSRPF